MSSTLRSSGIPVHFIWREKRERGESWKKQREREKREKEDDKKEERYSDFDCQEREIKKEQSAIP